MIKTVFASGMEREKVGRDYAVDFCQRPFTQKGAANQKVALDKKFGDDVHLFLI